ncbi:Conserved hypothetical protein (perhaps related to histidine degradation) [Pseudoalteromonas luteoviolacea B = ATCC 29581]|nr:Conserved hypothetical protein (perhaps related to histidine degradation) [Pseudoalteromonas luteoviolacea B = ATCC 29581]
MSITLIHPTEFKQVPWKNGKGITTELAINAGATIENFTFRISIASVNEDGPFSNFSGYTRHLVLLSGNGLHLSIGSESIALGLTSLSLEKPLDCVTFDGGSLTHGKLISGSIRDFNVIFNPHVFTMKTNTYVDFSRIELSSTNTYYVYACETDLCIKSQQGSASTTRIPSGTMAKIEQPDEPLYLEGRQMIIISAS